MGQVAILINGNSLSIKLSRAADKALQQRTESLHVEMELYFSCLIRKKVRFYENTDNAENACAIDKLLVSFRPVMTQTCRVDNVSHEPPVTDFPIVKSDKFTPRWLRLDFCEGKWQGQFGYGCPR